MKPRSQASFNAVRRGHARLSKVTLHNLTGEVGEVPIYAGHVGFDLTSRRGARYGQLEVPGYEWFDLFDPSQVTWVTVDFTIEGETWSIGEFPVESVEDEWPGGLVQVGLGDWAGRRSRSAAEFQQDMGYGGLTLSIADFFEHYMGPVVPGGSFTVTTDDTLGATKPFSPRVGAGSDVWRAMVDVAAAADAYLMVDSLTTGSVRRFDPYQPVHEDLTGTVNRCRTGWDMANVVNRVVVQVNSEDRDGGTYTGRKSISGGSPWDFDRDGIGYCILTDSETVPLASQAIANNRAQLLYDRRAGAVKSVSFRVVPQPWLEPGDIVFANLDGGDRAEQGVVDRIEYPLRADQPMQISLRGIPVI